MTGYIGAAELAPHVEARPGAAATCALQILRRQCSACECAREVLLEATRHDATTQARTSRQVLLKAGRRILERGLVL